MENMPGNGSTSPFGDENGATVAGGGASSGSSDFVTNPEGDTVNSGGRDFTKESKSQQMGSSDYNKDSVAADGILPLVDDMAAGGTQGVTSKPYKLGA